MNAKQWLTTYLDSHQGDYNQISDDIWSFSELKFDTPQSAKRLADHLKSKGFSIQSGVAGLDHAFIAEYGQGSPVIGFLAEYDPLPGMSQVADCLTKQAEIADGAGHGCGHNALGTGAVAGAVAIKEYMQANNLKGTLKVFGCPAEEMGYGKSIMAANGVFKNLDAILTWHPMDTTGNWGFSTLAVSQLYFSFTGLSSHAGAAPELGRSALDAAELMNVGVQFLREHMIDSARVHYAFIDVGGQAANVVQPTAKLHYFIRAPRREEVSALTERVIKIAKGAALMTETEVEITRDCSAAEYIVNQALGTAMYENLKAITPIAYTPEEYAYAQPFFDSMSETVKSGLAQRLSKVYASLHPDELSRLIKSPINDVPAPLTYSDKPMTGSTDVGDASWFAPTAQVTIAYGPNGTAPHSWQWVAFGKSGIAHKALLTAAKTIAMTAFDLLTNPSILSKAQEEHVKNMSGKVY